MRRALVPLLVMVLTACSSGGRATVPGPRAPAGPSPAASAGASTGASPSAAGAAPTALRWGPCGPPFSCATLPVPRDETSPRTGSVDLALTRVPATGPGSRLGALLVNPGGPGVSAVDFLQQAFSNIPAPVRARFDLVAFDPRGVGRSEPVRCGTTAQLDAYFHLDPAPDDTAGVAAYDAADRALARACRQRSGQILPFMSTATAARDMDRVRAALGEPRLTYLGYSYGTAIGAAYLEQFPTHVRAMVLDGALDPTLTWDQLLTGQSRGFDVALGSFLAWCRRTRCAFSAVGSGSLTAAYDALAARVARTPLAAAGQRLVGAGEFSYGVGQALYSTQYWPVLAAALASAQHGSGAQLLELSDSYLQRTGSGYSNLFEANDAVNCIDRPSPRTVGPYRALALQVARSYPRFGPFIALSGLVCAGWPVSAVSTPHAVHAPTAPPVLVIGTTRDPATPYTWAQGLARQLAHGVLLTHVGDGHTVYGVDAPACITGPVDAYLLTARPPTAATC